MCAAFLLKKVQYFLFLAEISQSLCFANHSFIQQDRFGFRDRTFQDFQDNLSKVYSYQRQLCFFANYIIRKSIQWTHQFFQFTSRPEGPNAIHFLRTSLSTLSIFISPGKPTLGKPHQCMIQVGKILFSDAFRKLSTPQERKRHMVVERAKI